MTRTLALTIILSSLVAFPDPGSLGAQTGTPPAERLAGADRAGVPTALEIVRAMRAGSGGRFTTATFLQRSLFADGREELWYEAMQAPGLLRIDTSIEDRNAMIFRNDSLYVFQGGARVAARPLIHPLLLMLSDVHVIAPEETLRKLRALDFDTDLVREASHEGRPTWVIGAAAGDSTSNQVWIDREHLYPVRMIQTDSHPQPGRRETLFSGWARVGGAWMESLIVMRVNGEDFLREEYRDIVPGVVHEPGLFDPDTYRRPAWVDAWTSAWPAARSTHGMVWHEGAGETLLLGGVGEADSTMWAWDGRAWNVRAVGGPAGRAHFGLAYDAGRDRVVVHGGVAALFGVDEVPKFADTWEWDGRSWHRFGATGPGQRDHHAMVYDPVRRQTILFGGHSVDSDDTALADTWAWDGAAWQKLADGGPPARSTHRMVFDSRRGRVIMFGGWNPDGLLNDTWAWDGERWTRLAEDGPAPRFATRMAYDAARDRVVLFGGRGAAGDFGDTWEFDGVAWTRSAADGPPTRNVHAMAYDALRQQVLLFGGRSSTRRFDDLWAFDGVRWRQIPRR